MTTARDAFKATFDKAPTPRTTRFALIQDPYPITWFNSRSEAEYFAREHRPEGSKLILTEKQARKEGYID